MQRAVVVMGKVPIAGRVKTRMTPAISAEQAASVYRAFLSDVFALVDRSSAQLGLERIFCCAVDDETEAQARALCPGAWRFVRQRAGGLGERIEGARADADAERVVILGSDAPTMPVERIGEAFASLERAPAVVGPTEDGGYYLIGLHGAQPPLLRDIPWSTERVMEVTRARAVEAGIDLVELAVGYDIDHVDDLPRAFHDAQAMGAEATVRSLAPLLRAL